MDRCVQRIAALGLALAISPVGHAAEFRSRPPHVHGLATVDIALDATGGRLFIAPAAAGCVQRRAELTPITYESYLPRPFALADLHHGAGRSSSGPTNQPVNIIANNAFTICHIRRTQRVAGG
jgi:hypothetical protein